MATMMESPPALPPEVAGQMGGQPKPFAGAGQGMMPPGEGGGVNPQGQAAAVISTVEKALANLARMDAKWQPIVDQAMQTLKKGLATVTSGGGQQLPDELSSPTMPGGGTNEGHSFPG